MEITRDILKSLIKEELTKEMIRSSDPMGGHDTAQWNYARTKLNAKMKSVLQDKESQVLGIDDKKIMRIMRGLNNVIGQNPHIAKKLSESIEAETAQKLEAAIGAAYRQMTTPTDVDQTYAGSGEPVSKDPQVMHDEAVKFLHLVVDDVASGNTLENPRTMHEASCSDLDEGFMDAIKRKIGTMPDDRSALEKIKTHPEMKGRDKLGPARGPIMSVIEKYASEEEMETILSALEQPAGAAIGLPRKENKD